MLHEMRKDYVSPELEIDDLEANPYHQFHNWFQTAIQENVNEPNAMTLATCTPAGRPSARIVLLKDYGEDGLSFFTNYDSRKGKEISANPHVALVLFWPELYRQIRVEGRVEKLPAEASEAYFQSRPKGSQIGAWSSPQSAEIDNREELLERVDTNEKRFEKQDKLPLPDFWGGYLVKPEAIEFWQGQPSRLHDRFRYTKGEGGKWEIVRLAP
jgi:pyridoxamine-phosphate oxidase